MRIDAILAGILILLTAVTVFYAVIKEYAWKYRRNRLLGIKRHVYELTLSGQKPDNKVCLPVISEASPREFLDVATNRNREAVFFNEAEQKIFKECFISVERVAKIEMIARKARDKWRRIEAILSLGYVKADSSLGILKESFNGKDADVSYFSMIALGQIRTLPSARILLDFLRKRRFYRYKIFAVLELFPPDITEEVIRLTDDADPEIRAWAVKLISRFRSVQYLEKIEEMAEDSSEEVRAAACDCLGRFGRKEANGVLVKCLGDDVWLVRAHAVKALSKVLGEGCLPIIVGRINDSSLSVIESVKDAIIENFEAAVPYVEDYLFSDNEVAKRVSIEALEASGYMKELFILVLSKDDERKGRARRILEGMIRARAHFGFEAALTGFTEDEREKLLAIIRNIDIEMADHLNKNIRGHKGTIS